ncbi:hypothetical protein QN239_32850 [Mycolicibacterium sp. Y3]
MCRSLKDGTRRRCASCTSYPAAARANGNRRQSRLARRKIVDHLNGLGLVDTASAVLAAPPSMLAPFMAALDIDPAVLGDVPMPGTGPNGSDATALIQQATSERAQQLARAQATAAAAAPAAANVPNCRTNIAVITDWEDRVESVFAAGGNKAQCRVACAEAEMLCKGCPLMESCAQEAKASHYTGVAGGRIFVNGRHRLTPSSPTRIVA